MPGRRAAAIAAFVEERRWWIVAGCIVANWASIAFYSFTAITHNGWVYQHGDDGSWYWTTSWALSTFHLPYAIVGMGWPFALMPFAGIAGPNMAAGLPAIMLVNVVVSAPLCVALMYLIGARLARPLFGMWVAALWVVLPIATVFLYRPSSRSTLFDSFFPTAFGLNALSDFPSMVVALACVYILLRTLDERTVASSALLGGLLGYLVLVKPANVPLVVVAIGALVVARRVRAAAIALAALTPGLLALAVWKRRGRDLLLPANSPPSSGGSGIAPTPQDGEPSLLHRVGDLIDRIAGLPRRYDVVDVHQAATNIHELREVFWSLRVIEFVLVAGAIAISVRFRWRGLIVIGWLAAYLIVKGMSTRADVYTTSAFRFLMPAWPAWVLLIGSLVYLWPRMGGLLPPFAAKRPARHSQVRWWQAVCVIGLTGFVPAAWAASAPRTARGEYAQIVVGGLVAIRDFGLEAHRDTDGSVMLDWKRQREPNADYVYRIYRADENGCTFFSPGAPTCPFEMTQLGYTRSTHFVDRYAQARSYYRVALAARWQFDDDTDADVLVLSKAVLSVR